MIEPEGEVLTPGEVQAALTQRTPVVCLTWVHSFSGQVVDLEGIGGACRSRGVWLVVKGSQAVSAMPVDARRRRRQLPVPRALHPSRYGEVAQGGFVRRSNGLGG